MSPPQLTMDKQALYVDVGHGQEVELRHKACSTRKLFIIASITFVSLLIVAGIVFGAVAYNYQLFYKEDYNFVAEIKGLQLPQHVHVDYNKQLIYVTNKQKGTTDALNALHNYDKKLLAFFDPTKNECFIDRLEDTFDEGLKRWSSNTGDVRIPAKHELDRSGTVIQPEFLRKFAGDEIADYCKNVTSYWMLNMPRQKREVPTTTVPTTTTVPITYGPPPPECQPRDFKIVDCEMHHCEDDGRWFIGELAYTRECCIFFDPPENEWTPRPWTPRPSCLAFWPELYTTAPTPTPPPPTTVPTTTVPITYGPPPPECQPHDFKIVDCRRHHCQDGRWFTGELAWTRECCLPGPNPPPNFQPRHSCLAFWPELYTTLPPPLPPTTTPPRI